VGALPGAAALERGEPGVAEREGAEHLDEQRACGCGGLQRSRDAVIRVRASLIISSWNGRHLLERCLPSALRAVAHAGGDHEVIVVDDGSTDDTVEYVQREFPEVRVVALPRNLRFAGANNAGARVARGDVLVFLNNDMQVSPGFLAPLLKHFEHPAVFAATARLQMKPRRVAGGYIEETGLVRARFEDGFFVLQHDQPITEEPVQVLYAGGGSSAVRRDRFFELGGFDRLFRPFYFEDLDISYRAQKHGWQVVYEPKSMMVHAHRQTNSPENFPGGYVDRMFGKNSLLFTWKVLTDRDLLGQHFRALWLSLMRPRAHPAMGAFFFRALAQLPGLLRARHRARRGLVLSDREAIARAAAPAQDEATEAGRIPYGSSGRGKHVLVIGFAPLPFEKERRLGALTFRTWHVTQALLAAGHEVTLVAVRMAAAYEEESRRPRALRFRGNHFTYYSVEHAVFDDGRFVQRVCNRIQPEALVTVHSYPTWAASRLDCDAPLWADLNGYGMSEAQARAAVAGDDAAVADAWRWERATLARADVFSVVSGRQKFALIGELAAVGRLKGSNYANDSDGWWRRGISSCCGRAGTTRGRMSKPSSRALPGRCERMSASDSCRWVARCPGGTRRHSTAFDRWSRTASCRIDSSSRDGFRTRTSPTTTSRAM
jgi:GT2 family glycosyltransferase